MPDAVFLVVVFLPLRRRLAEQRVARSPSSVEHRDDRTIPLDRSSSSSTFHRQRFSFARLQSISLSSLESFRRTSSVARRRSSTFRIGLRSHHRHGESFSCFSSCVSLPSFSSIQSLTAINNADELSFEHETSLNEGAMEIRQTTTATAWASSLERLLNDEIGLHVFTEFLKKEFSQENIQFWVECEKLKKLTDLEQVSLLSLLSFVRRMFSSVALDSSESQCDLEDVLPRYGRWFVSHQYRQSNSTRMSTSIDQSAHGADLRKSSITDLSTDEIRFLQSISQIQHVQRMSEQISSPCPTPRGTCSATDGSFRYSVNLLVHRTRFSQVEKKEKKRTAFLPWTKGKSVGVFVKRETLPLLRSVFQMEATDRFK